MATPIVKGVSGARCVLALDGKEIGWASGVEVDESVQQVRIDVLNDVYTKEIEVVGITVSGRIATVVMYGNTMAEASQGAKYAQGDKVNIILHPSATLTIVDSVLNKTLFVVDGLKFSGRTFNVDRMSVFMSNVSFQAIKLTTIAQTPTA